MLIMCMGNTRALSNLHPSDFNVYTLPPGVVLCVSLGMPDTVLRQYLKQGAALHIPLIIRGIYGKTILATGNRLFTLLNPLGEPSIKGGIAIDPHPFEAANVKAVPALVVSDGISNDVVYGNIPLQSLIRIAAKNGSSSTLKAMAMSFENHNIKN